MAIWEIQVIMSNGSRQWQNRWDVDIAALDDVPSAFIEALKDFYVPILISNFVLQKIVRRPAGSTDAFVESIYNLNGTRSPGGQLMPLFNTIKTLLQVSAGRPGFKFLRGVLSTADITTGGVIGGSIAATITTGIETLISDAVAAGIEIVLGNGKVVSSVSTPSVVQMRQEHRKRRRSP